MAQYSDAHKAFLQLLLKNRVLTITEATKLQKSLCQNYDVEYKEDFKTFIDQINQKLLHLHMAIRNVIQENENDDVPCCVLTNNLNNEWTRMYSSFKKPELAFIKQLIEALITADDCCIRVTDAINSGNNLETKVGASAAESLIDKLVLDKWILCNNGQLSLGCLTVCELQSYIQQNFEEESKKCYFCKEYTFRGYSCAECYTKCHRKCLRNYWRRLKKNNCCPKQDCQSEWDPNLFENNKRFRTDECGN